MNKALHGKGRKGFTLIELMIVVAIIGILAAIAIPNFLRFQLKSKTSEGKVNIAAIRTAEESYLAEFGVYVPAAASPAAFGGSTKIPFVDTGAAPPGNFNQIGWNPEGLVYFNYAVAIGVNTYTVDAGADIDLDGTAQFWGYVAPSNAGASVAGVLGCPATGTWDAVLLTLTAMNTVGPCGATFGQSTF